MFDVKLDLDSIFDRHGVKACREEFRALVERGAKPGARLKRLLAGGYAGCLYEIIERLSEPFVQLVGPA